VLRKSETKKNCLNPDWADFLINDREVGPHEQELRLKIEIFDNDYNSADQLLGVTHLSLKQLEAAATLGTSLKIGGTGNGKVHIIIPIILHHSIDLCHSYKHVTTLKFLIFCTRLMRVV